MLISFPLVKNELPEGSGNDLEIWIKGKKKSRRFGAGFLGIVLCGIYTASLVSLALMYSRFMRAMLAMLISFGHSAEQAPVLVQAPKPS
jgi:hypothetical protein